jgi:hypothetical protein
MEDYLVNAPDRVEKQSVWPDKIIRVTSTRLILTCE